MKRKIGITLVALGLALIIFAVGLLIYNNYENKRAEAYAADVINKMVDVIKQNKNSSTEKDPFDEEMKVVEIDGYGYIGYISIPGFNLNLPVMSEWDYSRLKISPCRYYGSTKTDNLVICAHNFNSHFGYIGKLEPDMAVSFTDMEGEITEYSVVSVEILQPTDTDKVKDTGDDLIVYTCTYGGRTRIAVRCEKTEK
ncbi:MAG: sortase [Ruminococcaceae bacterium]|nr:sortase [Oscillospiraceae bacterium]